MIGGETKTSGRITIFHLREDLTNDRIRAFTKKMSELIESGRTKIVLDLTAVEEVSLMGMVAISFLFNKCRFAGGSLKISKLAPLVRRSFRSSNLINTVEVYEDVIDAIKSFRALNLLKSRQFSGSFYLKDRNSFVTWDRLPVQGLMN